MRADGHNAETAQALWNWLALATLVALGIVWAPEPAAPLAPAAHGAALTAPEATARLP